MLQATWFTSIDFMTEGGGYLFCWATMSFFPYVCGLQARFLYLNPKEGLTNMYALGAIFTLNGKIMTSNDSVF